MSSKTHDGRHPVLFEDLLGLLIGIVTLAASGGYLAYVYTHPQRYRWLELPRQKLSEPPLAHGVPSKAH